MKTNRIAIHKLFLCFLLFACQGLLGAQAVPGKGAPSVLNPSQPATPVKGSLLIIGGGAIPDTVIQTFIRLAGGPAAKILIFPQASEIPVEAAALHRNQFLAQGARDVQIYRCQAGAMDQPECLKQIEQAGGLFFTGGDQNLLAQAFDHTQAFARIMAQHRRGGVIGGTSAGAAIMSQVMLTGAEKVPPATPETLPFATIHKDQVLTARGFGLVDRYVIDQHFLLRLRQNRLLSVVLDHPQLIGVGIDESTAILVHPDQHFEVLGNSGVMVFDATLATGLSSDARGNYAARNIRLHLLTAGQRFP